MTNKEVEKAVEILLQNQAQFYANLQEIQEIQKESEKRVSVLERATVNLFNAMTKTNETVDRLSEKVDKLSEKVDKLADAQKETDERWRETDERLNAVIFMAEKFFSGNNGKSEN
jgi:flagellar biosynthesis chaperone FliJ